MTAMRIERWSVITARTLGLGVLCALVVAGCLRSSLNTCANSGVCPAGYQCTNTSGAPQCVLATCGNGVVDPGEFCDDGNHASGDSCPADCQDPCGNGVIDPHEVCDDGNRNDGDGCSADCQSTEACGNAIVDPGEVCDDGNAQSHDGCSARCTAEVAGWTALEAAPERRGGHAMAYDARRGAIVLYGGAGASGPLGDTWEWNGVIWRQRTPKTVPPARTGHAMAFEAARGRIVMFGGGSPTEHSTWEWDGTDWAERLPAVTPPPQLTGAAMAYDAARQRVVLFGGSLAGVAQNRTWMWDGTTWQELAAGAGPSPRAGHAMAYDSGRHKIVVFGGVAGGQRLGDTWELDDAGWTQPAAAGAPTSRAHAAMVFDAVRGKIVLLGGDDGSGEPALVAWTWDGAQWSAIPATGGPQTRSASAAAYDGVRGRVVLFGGQLKVGGELVASLFGDTWIWDGATWSPRAVSTQVPLSRIDPALVYDPARGRVVLFGGTEVLNLAFATVNDTWEWNGASWMPAVSTTLPTSRSDTAIAADGAHLVVFGGSTIVGGFRHDLGDTWVSSGAQWVQQTPAVSPSARSGHAMAYDAARGKVVLFGGAVATTQPFGDTWEWDGARWTQLHPAHAPPARSFHALAYDSARQRVVLFGGADLGSPFGPFNDTWEWDGTDWIQDTPATLPPPLQFPAMAYDAGRDRLVVFDKDDFGFHQTWEWDGIDWHKRTSATVPALSGTPVLAYDARRALVVMIDGGEVSTEEGIVAEWEWDGADWHKHVDAPLQPPVIDPVMVYDAARANIVLFGGRTDVSVSSDTWIWDGTRWQLRSPPVSPAPRFAHAMAFDSARNKVVLFGGQTSTSDETTTWEWDGSTWQAQDPITSPPARQGHVLVYDSALHKTLLFGGLTRFFDPMDLWAWDGTNWAQLPSVDAPLTREGFAATYDPGRDRVVVFGGFTDLDGLLNDIWEWDGTRWANLTPKTGPAPPPRSGHNLVYDAMHARVLLFGGVGGTSGGTSGGTPLNDVWTWDGTRWTELPPLPPAAPYDGAALACDTAHGYILSFGGRSLVSLHDTWFYGTEDPGAPDQPCYIGDCARDGGRAAIAARW
jgi:cysteine-rich repeat protein